MKKVYEVTSYIELDLDEICEELEKRMSSEIISPSDVCEYVEENVSSLKVTGGIGIYEASDGPRINNILPSSKLADALDDWKECRESRQKTSEEAVL